MPYIKLYKVSEVDQPVVPNNMPVGYERIGLMTELPKVGESFCLPPMFYTSTVLEIVDAETFKTKNSIYKIEILKESLCDLLNSFVLDSEGQLLENSIVKYKDEPTPYRIKHLFSSNGNILALINNKEFTGDFSRGETVCITDLLSLKYVK